ncbi:hypothetical protein [Aeromicrobium sp.]|uniref:hypothetical protein n=1 Tax=Aeromicrobium sp. TaxID=1871063 RepID=UPI001993F3EB|nr:hypothetical protein [Aeromicrobium sp.]MBC7630024.1 hypothetical protein [Aeromicrobium sp.]
MPTLIFDGHPFLLADHGDVGLSRRQVIEAAQAGALRRVLDRVYIDAAVRDTRAVRLESIRLVAPPQAVVADEWAAWVYGVDAFSPSQRHRMIPTLLVPHGQSRSRIPGVRCRQPKLSSEDIHSLDRVLLTTPVRTTSDMLRKRWRPHALSSADTMAHAGLVTPGEVQDYLAGLKGYPGIRQARNLATWIEPLTQSPGESWSRLRMLDAGFPRPQAQWCVVDVDGVERWVDLAYPEVKLGAEYDGQEFHSSGGDRALDRGRRTALGARGIRFVITGYEGIFGTDSSFEEQIGRFLGQTPLHRRW